MVLTLAKGTLLVLMTGYEDTYDLAVVEFIGRLVDLYYRHPVAGSIVNGGPFAQHGTDLCIGRNYRYEQRNN